MQNLIGYSQCVNRSSPSPSSPENVKKSPDLSYIILSPTRPSMHANQWDISAKHQMENTHNN